jgi:hypothetical protein
MGTWNAFYVRAGKDNRFDASVIQQQFPGMPIEATPHFLGVRMADEAYVPPEPKLLAMSATLATDVMWLGFQSTVDAFYFHHWRSGDSVRCLIHGCFEEEGTWDRAEGACEPWEREAFFSQGALENALRYATVDANQEELQRIWREAEILPGRTEPRCDARECAHMVAAYYRFPHFGLHD